jgi:hypothetical protein
MIASGLLLRTIPVITPALGEVRADTSSDDYALSSSSSSEYCYRIPNFKT